MAGFQLKLPLTWESFPPQKKKGKHLWRISIFLFQPRWHTTNGRWWTNASCLSALTSIEMDVGRKSHQYVSVTIWSPCKPLMYGRFVTCIPTTTRKSKKQKDDNQLFIISWSCLTVPFTQPGLWWHRPANATNHCNYVTRELPLTSPTTKPPKPSYWIESLASADIRQLARKLFFFRLQLRKGSVRISTSTSTW